MNHTDYQDLCAVHALGALDGDDLVQLERHLPECADCQKLVREYRESATGVAAASGSQKPSAGVKDKIFEEIHRTSKASGPNFRMNWAVAAAILVAIGAGYFAQRSYKKLSKLEPKYEQAKKTIEDQKDASKK